MAFTGWLTMMTGSLAVLQVVFRVLGARRFSIVGRRQEVCVELAGLAHAPGEEFGAVQRVPVYDGKAIILHPGDVGLEEGVLLSPSVHEEVIGSWNVT